MQELSLLFLASISGSIAVVNLDQSVFLMFLTLFTFRIPRFTLKEHSHGPTGNVPERLLLALIYKEYSPKEYHRRENAENDQFLLPLSLTKL